MAANDLVTADGVEDVKGQHFAYVDVVSNVDENDREFFDGPRVSDGSGWQSAPFSSKIIPEGHFYWVQWLGLLPECASRMTSTQFNLLLQHTQQIKVGSKEVFEGGLPAAHLLWGAGIDQQIIVDPPTTAGAGVLIVNNWPARSMGFDLTMRGTRKIARRVPSGKLGIYPGGFTMAGGQQVEFKMVAENDLNDGSTTMTDLACHLYMRGILVRND
jgi:hypothetical protein